MWTKIKIAAVVILLIVVAIIAFQNRESVDTRLLFVTVTMPRAALLFVTLVIGFACGVLATWSIVARSKQEAEDG